MSKKSAELSAGLVAVKGSAMPPSDMPTRTAPVLVAVPAAPVPPADPPSPPPPKAPQEDREGQGGNLAPLNFRVSSVFRREFKTYAATHDLKLNELLRLSFEAYRQQNGH